MQSNKKTGCIRMNAGGTEGKQNTWKAVRTYQAAGVQNEANAA